MNPRPRRRQSYTLTVTRQLSPLVDEAGESPHWTPCQVQPYAWDEEAPINVRITAAQVCVTQCPAIHACRELLAELGPVARGVWAGFIISGRGDPEMIAPPSGTGRHPRRLPPMSPEVIHIV
jgi:hypothetical protein